MQQQPGSGGAPAAFRLATLTDLRWFLLWGAFTLALGSLPYLLVWARTPPGHEFTGILIHPADGFSYLAKMRQGWDGAVLFTLPYTTEAQTPAPLFLFYLFRGHVARWTGLSLIEVYHLFRVGEAAVMLAAFWDLLGFLSPDRRSRRAAYVIGCLGAGLGWLALPSGLIAPDLKIPEGWLFFSLLANPHFPAALACLALTVTCAARAIEQSSRAWTAAGALACLAAALVHPFLCAPLGLLLIALAALNWRTYRKLRVIVPLVLIFAAGAAVTAVQSLALLLNPVLAVWTAQNRLPSPPPHEVLLGYGTPLLLALSGVFIIYVKPAATNVPGGVTLAAVWLAAGLALLYAPIAFQRRFYEGIQFPLAALAGVGLMALWERGPLGRRLAAVLLMLAVPSTLLNIVLPVAGAGAASATAYLSPDDRAAYDWLAAHATRDDVVLAGPVHSNQIPAYSPARVVWGHPFETVDSETKRKLVRDALAGSASDEIAQFLQEQRVTLVLIGDEERTVGEVSPRFRERAEPVFGNGGVTILRLAQSAP